MSDTGLALGGLTVLPDRDVVHVLLVEDNEGDAFLAQERLVGPSNAEFELTPVPTLAAAMLALESMVFDAIVLDLNLPDSRGLETVRRLRDAGPEIPIVVLTAMADQALHDAAVREGAEDSIGKDEPRAHLLARSILYAVERRRAVARSRETESLVAANPDAVIVFDVEGVVQFVNDAAVELFGRSRDRLLGDRLESSVEPGFGSAEPGVVSSVDIVAGNRRRLGEMRVVELTWMGRPASLVILRDVTERERLAEQMRQSQKMEAIGRLAGGVAHDFNNQLTVILGSAELAQGHVGPEAEELIAEILRAAYQAARTTGQLLALSRRSPQRLTAVDLNGLVTETAQLLGRVIGENISLELDLDPELDEISVDRGQMEQVVMNLALNARDAMPAGGRLVIATAGVDLEEAYPGPEVDLAPGRYACLTVTDSGTGMTEEVRSQIFEPFFTTKEMGQGTGLGLAMAYSAVSRSGGRIAVYSEVDRGSTFRIYLPMASRARSRSQAEPSEPEADPSGTETVLVVDDNPAVRQVLAATLTRAGYSVVIAESGREAIELSHSREIELVVTDVVMPEMTGLELAEQLRGRWPSLPVLFISGYPAGVGRPLDAVAECVPFLEKPFTRSGLVQAVRAALDGVAPG